MVQPSSGGGPKDVKNAKREVQLDLFIGRVSGRMEGSCPVVVRHVDEPEANRPHTRVCEGLLSWFFLDIFDMTEEDRLFDFMKGLQPTPKCPRLRGGTGS